MNLLTLQHQKYKKEEKRSFCSSSTSNLTTFNGLLTFKYSLLNVNFCNESNLNFKHIHFCNVQDEGSFSLKTPCKTMLQSLGSDRAFDLGWRDMWAMITVKGGKYTSKDTHSHWKKYLIWWKINNYLNYNEAMNSIFHLN